MNPFRARILISPYIDMKQYIEANKERFFEELFSLLRIPSISAKREHKPDMQRCAERLVELLKEAGADEAYVTGMISSVEVERV